jgi:hypothetical protein
MELTEEQRKVRPVRVLEVWRQPFSGYWIAQLSNGMKVGAHGDDEIQAFAWATRWVDRMINDES